MQRLNVQWVVPSTGREIGNVLGYATASEQLRRALSKHACVREDAGEIAVHFRHPANYEPVPGAVNVLFTMFERDDWPHLREYFAPAFRRADWILTPSAYCLDLFRACDPETGEPLCGETPVQVCPLGVELELFPYKRRRWRPGETFRWLYMGAPNPRKYTIMQEVADLLFPGLRAEGLDVELYIKTTTDRSLLPVALRQSDNVRIARDQWGEVAKAPGVVIDNRRLPRDSLAREIFWKAHGMLFLHCGEGWGLTGLEAMATGLPLVVSDHSGTREFADARTAFPVAMERKRIRLAGADGAFESSEEIELDWPDFFSATDQVARVMTDYHHATKVAARGAEVARAFSWDAAGRRLAGILTGIGTRHRHRLREHQQQMET